MLDKLTEFNNELTELGEVINKIEALPSDLQDIMMDKFKNTVLQDNEPVKKPIQQEDEVKSKISTTKKRTVSKILTCLPELTVSEAEAQVKEIRSRYMSAPYKRKIEILLEIPSQKMLINATGFSSTTIQRYLDHPHDSPIKTGVVGKIKIDETRHNSPAFYYIIKKESEDAPSKDHKYTKNSKPYSQSKPWVVMKDGRGYTIHRTREERDEAYEIGLKTDWDKAKMYKLPNYVIYDGENTYSIFIPKTNHLLREKISLQEVYDFVEWINEAKDYDGGAKVNFDSYFNVSFNTTSKGLPS